MVFNNTTYGNESGTCQELIELTYFQGDVLKYSVITVFSVVATFGFLGNLLVILAVIRSPAMRTPRNYFIINLAFSDLTLCCVTLPFTLYQMFSLVWPFGWFACKAISISQAVNMFVSTMSITAIGLDRYLVVILVPTNPELQKLATTLVFTLVWGVSVFMAAPMLMLASYGDFAELLAGGPELKATFERCGVPSQYCQEERNSEIMTKPLKASYTVGCFLFQYCLPLFTLTFTYSKVLGQLRARISFRKRANGGEMGKVERETRKQQRANLLVVLIIVIFAIVWLPFNVQNIMREFTESASKNDPVFEKIVFASCYITAMLSACANPILYGILNANFRYEFASMLQLAHCCPEQVENFRLDVTAVTRVYHQAVAARNSIVDSILARKSSRCNSDGGGNSDVVATYLKETTGKLSTGRMSAGKMEKLEELSNVNEETALRVIEQLNDHNDNNSAIVVTTD